VTNSSRITWFLRLQRTLLLPRYPLAPFPNLFRFRKVNLDPSKTAAFATSEMRTEAIAHKHSPVRRLTTATEIFTPKPTVAARDYLPGHRSMPLLSPTGSDRISLRVADLSQMVSRSRPGMPQNDPATTGIAGRAGFQAGRAPRGPPALNVSGNPSAVLAGFAPLGSSSLIQGLSTPKTEGSTRKTIRGGDSEIGQFNPPAANAHQTFNESSFDRMGSEQLDRGEPEQDVRRQQQRRSASTLHIDGAALGRWTIQHLTRTLGKPSTGMTGVDPRMTLPRSRVQPF
jgi:hypothetical protein